MVSGESCFTQDLCLAEEGVVGESETRTQARKQTGRRLCQQIAMQKVIERCEGGTRKKKDDERLSNQPPAASGSGVVLPFTHSPGEALLPDFSGQSQRQRRSSRGDGGKRGDEGGGDDVGWLGTRREKRKPSKAAFVPKRF